MRKYITDILLKDYKTYLNYGNKMISKQEAKTNPQSARSIASYLNTARLTEDDKIWIAKITQPKGWRPEFNEPDKLSADDLLERSTILGRITKFPPLKVRISSRMTPSNQNILSIRFLSAQELCWIL